MLAFFVGVPRERGRWKWYAAWGRMPKSLMLWSNRLKEKDTFINFAEFVALFSVYLSVPQVLEGRHVVHFGDNEVANSVAIKGTSRAKDLSRAVVDLRLCWFQLRLAPWIARVASKANPADGPTRENFSFVEKRRDLGDEVEIVPLVLPSFGSWGDGSWERLDECVSN